VELPKRPREFHSLSKRWRLLKRNAPDNRQVREVLAALKREVHIPWLAQSAMWLQGPDRPGGWAEGMTEQYPPSEVTACRNVLVHVATGTVIDAAPLEFFHLATSAFNYESDAGEPVQWLQFLNQIFEDDAQSVAATKQMFGYVLSGKLHLQKIFLLIGPRRSGKSTMVRLLEELIGRNNAGSRSVSDLGATFGLDGLENRKLVVFSDVRSDSTTKASARVPEQLLKVSGGDRVNVNRKYLSTWEGDLKVHILMVSNQVPTFTDQSGALASRFIAIKTRKCFDGAEDHLLMPRLMQELPAIFRWAMEGYQELHAEGRFVQPDAGRDELRQMAEALSIVSNFVRECCVLNPGTRVAKQELFDRFKKWCEENNQHACSSSEFGSALMAAFPVTGDQKTMSGGRRKNAYTGIGLQGESLQWPMANERPAA